MYWKSGTTIPKNLRIRTIVLDVVWLQKTVVRIVLSSYYSRPLQRDCYVSIVWFVAALCNRTGHYIVALWFLCFLFLSFPGLISAVADWMSTILPHTMLRKCEFRCAARGSLEMQEPKVAKINNMGTIAQHYRTVSSQLRHLPTIGKHS